MPRHSSEWLAMTHRCFDSTVCFSVRKSCIKGWRVGIDKWLILYFCVSGGERVAAPSFGMARNDRRFAINSHVKSRSLSGFLVSTSKNSYTKPLFNFIFSFSFCYFFLIIFSPLFPQPALANTSASAVVNVQSKCAPVKVLSVRMKGDSNPQASSFASTECGVTLPRRMPARIRYAKGPYKSHKLGSPVQGLYAGIKGAKLCAEPVGVLPELRHGDGAADGDLGAGGTGGGGAGLREEVLHYANLF